MYCLDGTDVMKLTMNISPKYMFVKSYKEQPSITRLYPYNRQILTSNCINSIQFHGTFGMYEAPHPREYKFQGSESLPCRIFQEKTDQ